MTRRDTGIHALASIALLVLLGCVAPNPAYDPEFDPGPADLAGMPPKEDLRSPADDLRGPDGDCAQGARRCRRDREAWISQGCRAGAWVDDRRCPANAGCEAGYCQPPAPQGPYEGKPCARENDCFLPNTSSEYSCQPFVRLQDRTVEGVCARRVGMGTPGTRCQPPDGNGCRSGFCDEVSHAGRNYCYRLCVISSDCPTNPRTTCAEARVTVEGISYSKGKSCIPN